MTVRSSPVPDAPSPIHRLDVLVTAGQAFPALERAFLAAQHQVLCGFRVFDLSTRLRSDAAKEIGRTWLDLFAHTLARGVDITMILSDFDPIVATDLHRGSWESAHQMAVAAELASQRAPGSAGRMTFHIDRHPARAGLIPRLLFRPKVREKLQQADASRYTPGLDRVSERDLFQLHPATHHQKLAVFDRARVYIGGIDLDERRFDTPDHDRNADQTWADVQVMAEGPIAETAARHLESFQAVTAGQAKPLPQSDGFLRTLSAARGSPLLRIAPKSVVTEIETAHLQAIHRARRLIYLETQYFRHKPLARALARAARRNRDLRLILILPAAPEEIAFEGNEGQDVQMGEALQAQCVSMVTQAFGDRCIVASPAQAHQHAQDDTGRETLDGAPIIYVHSKVSIFDRDSAIVSSANLNGRSLRWDTEAGLQLTRPAHVDQIRRAMLDHWFPGADLADLVDDLGCFDACRRAILSARDAPQPCLLLPYDTEPAEEIGKNTPLAPDELV